MSNREIDRLGIINNAIAGSYFAPELCEGEKCTVFFKLELIFIIEYWLTCVNLADTRDKKHIHHTLRPLLTREPA